MLSGRVVREGREATARRSITDFGRAQNATLKQKHAERVRESRERAAVEMHAELMASFAHGADDLEALAPAIAAPDDADDVPVARFLGAATMHARAATRDAEVAGMHVKPAFPPHGE